MTPGFGLEKLGLLALRFPRWTLLVIAIVTVALGYYASKIQFSSDVREIFRSESPDFVNLTKVEDQYSESVGRSCSWCRQTIFSRAKSRALAGPAPATWLRRRRPRRLVDVLRPLPSRRIGPERPHISRRAKSRRLPKIREAVLHNPLVEGTLLSKDGKTGLFIIGIEPQPNIEDLRHLTAELNGVIDTALAGSDIRVRPTGVAYLRLEIVSSLIRDQRTFITVGFVISFVVSWLFFRSIVYAILGAIPAVVAVIWLVGTTELRGQQVNVLTGVVPALVIVLVVASALHLLFGVRRNLANGEELRDAIASSVAEIGPACVLASVTTAIALLTLMLVPHDLVAGFGLTAAIGTAIAFLATIRFYRQRLIWFLALSARSRPRTATSILSSIRRAALARD